MQHARMVANKKLVEKAVKARQLREDSVKLASLRKGDWVLVRAENRQKFEGRWFGPYKVLDASILGTYRLQDPSGNVVSTLINGQRLVPAQVQGEDIKGLWNSSKIQGALRKRNITLNESSPEVAELFEKESADTPSYEELASISIAWALSMISVCARTFWLRQFACCSGSCANAHSILYRESIRHGNGYCSFHQP